ncbi:MAG: hypothetical protein E6H81_14555 [Chloroflexi bacterium]|nr:MAG: hypothetical protein E6H81_14555 [Chloroflexota bacterium]
MNKMIALKSFAQYLARRKIWYAGSADARQSVLATASCPVPAARACPGTAPTSFAPSSAPPSTGTPRFAAAR